MPMQSNGLPGLIMWGDRLSMSIIGSVRAGHLWTSRGHFLWAKSHVDARSADFESKTWGDLGRVVAAWFGRCSKKKIKPCLGHVPTGRNRADNCETHTHRLCERMWSCKLGWVTHSVCTRVCTTKSTTVVSGAASSNARDYRRNIIGKSADFLNLRPFAAFGLVRPNCVCLDLKTEKVSTSVFLLFVYFGSRARKKIRESINRSSGLGSSFVCTSVDGKGWWFISYHLLPRSRPFSTPTQVFC